MVIQADHFHALFDGLELYESSGSLREDALRYALLTAAALSEVTGSGLSTVLDRDDPCRSLQQLAANVWLLYAELGAHGVRPPPAVFATDPIAWLEGNVAHLRTLVAVVPDNVRGTVH